MKAVIALTLLLGVVASADSGMNMRCRVNVPEKYRTTPFKVPPNGQAEPVRYKVAYEAFWWNCVTVRGSDLESRCPFTANGTPAASAGAKDGALNAEFQIEVLLKKAFRISRPEVLTLHRSQSRGPRKDAVLF